MPNITQTITLERSEPADHATGTTTTLAAGDNYMHGQMLVGITEETIAISADIGFAGLLYLYNKSASNFIQAGFATGDYPLRLYPNEQGSIPLAPGTSTIYVVADTATCKMEYEVSERVSTIDVLSSPSASPSG